MNLFYFLFSEQRLMRKLNRNGTLFGFGCGNTAEVLACNIFRKIDIYITGNGNYNIFGYVPL